MARDSECDGVAPPHRDGVISQISIIGGAQEINKREGPIAQGGRWTCWKWKRPLVSNKKIDADEPLFITPW